MTKPKKNTILIVDDEPNTLKALNSCLREAGFKVLTTKSGEAALKRVARIKPDLILLEVKMPDLDGFETCRRLKAKQATRDIPIIFLTGAMSPADKIKGFELGGADYITKPFHPDEVLARVIIHLTTRSLQKQLEAQDAQLQQEIVERERVEATLRQANVELETRVRKRTVELLTANQQLRKEIAERVQAEKSLQASKELYQQMFDRHGSVMLLIDPKTGAIAKANAAAQRFYGYTRTELESLTIMDINTFTPEQVAQEMEQAIAEKRNHFLFKHRLATGEIRDVEVHSVPVINVQGHRLLYSIIHNITERVQAEEALQKYRDHLEELIAERTAELTRANEQLHQEIAERMQAKQKIQQQNEFLNNIIESLVDPFYVINVDDYTLQIANSAARALGTIEMRTCYALTHHWSEPCGGLEHPCPLAIVQKTKGPVMVEHIHFDEAGNLINVEVHGYPIFNDQGDIVQMIEYILDITERKQAEDEREKLITDLQEALDNIKTLKGLLPICAHCKKIRDDEGYWQDVSVYIRDHSEAEFSHGICPDCMKEFYPDFYEEEV